ncbi:hypothetical protein [Vreelandella populi]|uniref:Uncharacterized protein n=1 Tax=Vreelandella populi TaxID=2498858 RepID=A0A3S1E8N8_9GAMM|nr:hypothetical protein [Halomonas populi]RUR35332.1 hypothetical protein ELY25_15105 [Halomonas populi]RUR47523.1 hypothetical protein ELY37_04460 [Halomonas populi]
MLSLTPTALLNVLRDIASHHCPAHTDMLPSAGTPERSGLSQAVQHFFGLADGALLTDASITLEEWAKALSEAACIRHLNVFDTISSGAFNHQLQRSYRHRAETLAQEVSALKGLFDTPLMTNRTLVSWLPLQTVSGFMLGALLPQEAGFKTRSLFDHANALWKLNAGDIVVTSSDRWGQLAERLPSLPANITAVTTTPLDKQTYQTLLANGVAQIIELYGQPSTGILAMRTSQEAPFELLTHWHPTESDDVLLQLTANGVPEETSLGAPLHWVGARHFTTAHEPDVTRGIFMQQLFERPGQFVAESANAA